MTYDPKRQLDSENHAELERHAGPFWPLITIALMLGLLIWSMS